MDTKQPRDSYKAFRLKAAGIGLLVTAACALVAWYFDARVAAGIGLGGVAGTAGFWSLAARVAQLRGLSRAQAAAEMYRGMFIRLALYGVALTVAYRIDPKEMYALLGAAGAIIVMRTLLVFVGFAGIVRRLRKEQS